MSNGATAPCEAGTVAGVGGIMGVCAPAVSVTHITARAAAIFPEVLNLKNLENIFPLLIR